VHTSSRVADQGTSSRWTIVGEIGLQLLMRLPMKEGTEMTVTPGTVRYCLLGLVVEP